MISSKWNYLPLTSEQKRVEAQLATKFPNCPAISQLLVQRGIDTGEEGQQCCHPSRS